MRAVCLGFVGGEKPCSRRVWVMASRALQVQGEVETGEVWVEGK